ncbi:transcriptional regulator MntR [Natronospora cellulosivora (SeqCode)]
MLTESMEDYLEMIYRINKDKGYIKAVDLAEALNLQAPSITKMIQKLDEAGFVSYEKYRNISLTERGEKYGEFLVWRDKTLKDFLELLSDQKNADEQVEGIEHYITPKTMDLISSIITYFKNNPDQMKDLYDLQKESLVPHRNLLEELRAWEYKHEFE